MSHFAFVLPTVHSDEQLMTQTLHCRRLIWGTFVYLDMSDVFEPNGSMEMCDDLTLHIIITCMCIVKPCNKALL